jgi:hypothetical protein
VAENASVVNVKDVKQNDKFFTGITVPNSAGRPTAMIPGGVAGAKNKKLTMFQVTPTDVTQLRGDIIEMFVPDGQGMVQIEADPPSGPVGQSWTFWIEVGNIGLKDDKGTVHKLVGAWASVDVQGATQVTGAFTSEPGNPLLMPQMTQPQSPPSKIWLAAYVPKGVKVKEVVLANQVLKTGLDLTVQ